MNHYKKVILIGYGSVANDCLRIVSENFNGEIDFIRHEKEFLETRKIDKVKYHNLENKKEVENFFLNIEEECIVVSCNNNYLFTKQIIKKENLFLINFHSALLPLHKGRNAQTWSIFEQDLVTGITWHKINEKVDSGDILIQKKIILTGAETALNLTRTQMKIGVVAFKEIFPKINYKTIELKESLLETDQPDVIHFSKDIPNDGFIDLAWSIEKIYAFLRSIDYGIVNTFPNAKINFLGSKAEVLKYKISEIDKEIYQITLNVKSIIIREGKKELILKIK
jgi:methionyl-tRNA formyltransferase